MKKNLVYLFALAIAFTSCKKEDSTIAPSSENTNAQKAVVSPINFTKKVLVEEFVGCSYGNVPNSNYALNTIWMGNTNRVIIASMHINDVMQTSQSVPLVNSFGNSSSITLPCALINRTGNTGTRLLNYMQYNAKVQQALAQVTPCGLAITSKLSGNMAEIEVKTKFSSAVTGAFTVSAYLVHQVVNSSAANYGQANNFNSTSGHPFYGKGNPVIPYTHQHVVFRTLESLNSGRVQNSALVAGGIDVQRFNCDIPQYQMSNDCYVIAYITNNATREVINVQKVKLGMNQNWD